MVTMLEEAVVNVTTTGSDRQSNSSDSTAQDSATLIVS